MAWWALDEWQRLRDGIDCPMCADAHLTSNDFSDLIAELRVSFARLHRNQSHPGYAVVILKDHAAEIHELQPHVRAAFFDDVADVGRAVTRAFSPRKLDTLVMGHRCPHVHCHVYPQFESDDPLAVVDISAGDLRLNPAEQTERVLMLRAMMSQA